MSVKLPALLVVWFLKVSQLCETLMQGQYLTRSHEGKWDNSGPVAGTSGQPASDEPLANPDASTSSSGCYARHNFFACRVVQFLRTLAKLQGQ